MPVTTFKRVRTSKKGKKITETVRRNYHGWQSPRKTKWYTADLERNNRDKLKETMKSLGYIQNKQTLKWSKK